MRELVYAAIFIAAFGTFVSRAVKDGSLHAPPEKGDGYDYDALAFNIWQHQRFGYHWDDPRWRQPYELVIGYEDLLNRHADYYPTTYRQPALPAVMAVVYAATNRNFAAWRLVNCAFMAAAVTLAAGIAAHFAGSAAAVVTALLALSLPLLASFASQFVTEGLAAFLVTLLAWRLKRNLTRGWTCTNSVVAGLVLGSLIATRNIFVLWLPLMALAPGRDRRSDRTAWRGRAICVATALLVIGPWWVRNVMVLDVFMPLGTQGALNLPAGFGPRALQFEGMWAGNPDDGYSEISALKLDPVVSEVQLAKLRSSLALTWIRDHPVDALRLMGMHVWQEIRPRTRPAPTDAWLLPLAMMAAVYFRTSSTAWIIVAMVGANMLGIALTWSVGGRFMVPLQPLLAALAGAFIVAATRRLAEQSRTYRRNAS